MKTLVKIELLKLKRSTLVPLSLVGALTPPLLILVGLLKANYIDQVGPMNFEAIMQEGNLYTILLFYPILYSILAAFLFTRDYTEQTIKTMFSLPIHKKHYLHAKFLLYFLWTLGIGMLSYITMVVVALISGAFAVQINILLSQLIYYLISNLLLSLSFTTIILSALLSKNIYVPLLLAASICLINIFLSNEPLAYYFPFSYPYLITRTKDLFFTRPELLGFLFTIITGLSGYLLSLHIFQSRDIL